MNQMHPDEVHSQIALRQEIVQRGLDAAKHPGDLAGLRELIGRILISAGERIRGHQVENAPVAIPGRSMQLAR